MKRRGELQPCSEHRLVRHISNRDLCFFQTRTGTSDSWNSAADGFQKWNSESLYPGRINENLCQFVERWQIFVRYFMIEMKQMLYALFRQKALYFFYIWSVASYCYYLYFLFPLILCKTCCSAFSFGKQSYRFCQQ